MAKIKSTLPKPVFVNTALRTPIGKFGGSLTKLRAGELAAACLKAVHAKSLDSSSENIDFVFMGHGRQAGGGPNTARQATIFSGMSESTPATTLNHACASGMVAAIHGAEKIALGRASRIFSGGVESMSNTPYMSLNARWGNKMGNMTFEDGMYLDGFHCPMADMVMGQTVEDFIVPLKKISRDDQDAYALLSQHKATKAEINHFFSNERFELIHPKLKQPLNIDEHVRPQTTNESLKKLSPVFNPTAGTITAGNASGITDGAAFIELSAIQNDSTLVEILDWEYCALEPKLMGLGPVPVIENLLKRHELKVSDVDIFEINEAFAAQAIACQRELKISDEQLNPLGGAIALGHPIGATGARLLVTLSHQLKKLGGGKIGIASLCVSGGQGVGVLLRS